MTALHWACLYSPFVLLLLQRGADVTARNDWDETPLITAARRGHIAVVRVLLEHGRSDLDAALHNGLTASHSACTRGHSGVLRQLLEAGADPLLRDSQGRTALDLAAEYGHHKCVRLIQVWEQAYTLVRVRRVRDATSATTSTTSPAS